MKKLKFICSSSKWSETEKEVAEIIRDLYRVCLLSSVPFSWGCKRKRSSIQNKVPSSPNKRLCTFNGGGAVVLKGGASSPTTPFSFPVSDSEEQIKHLKNKISLKKKKESSLETIEDLTKTKTLLNQEIENVKKYHDQLKDLNLNLKIKKQELLCNSNLKNSDKVQLDDETNGLVNTSESKAENEEQQLQLQNNGLSSTGLGRNINSDNNGPITVLVQNLPSNATRAISAAHARQRRLNILRLKKREQRESKRRKNLRKRAKQQGN